MTSKVVKNPNRGKKKYRNESYRPEYVRLNVVPKAEPGFANSKSLPKNVLHGVGEVNSNAPFFLHKQEYRGSTKELYPSEEDNQENLAEQINEIEFLQEENLNSDSEFSLPDYVALEDIASSDALYFIFVTGEKILFEAFSQEEAEKIIEKLLFSEESPFSKLKLENFLILKKLELNFGIFAK